MKWKKFSAVGVIALAVLALCGSAVAWKTAESSKTAPSQLGQVEVVQIPEVAITKAAIAPDPDGAHGVFRFSIRNDSKKAIEGFAISIKGEFAGVGGKVVKSNGWTTVNKNIHPDLNAQHKHSHSIASGAEELVKEEKIVLDETLIAVKKLTLQIKYVRFTDGSWIGEERPGELVTGLTIGAEKYKQWLVAKYLAAGRSKTALSEILNAASLPPELSDLRGGERTGAFMYKNHFRRGLAEKTVNVDDFLK